MSDETHVHIHLPECFGESLTALKQEIARMSAQLDALAVQVAETNTVIGSAVTLIQGIAAQLAAVQAELAALGIDNTRLNELATSLDTTEQALAAAVAANTPAA